VRKQHHEHALWISSKHACRSNPTHTSQRVGAQVLLYANVRKKI
jgi:hypothetical protein